MERFSRLQSQCTELTKVLTKTVWVENPCSFCRRLKAYFINALMSTGRPPHTGRMSMLYPNTHSESAEIYLGLRERERDRNDWLWGGGMMYLGFVKFQNRQQCQTTVFKLLPFLFLRLGWVWNRQKWKNTFHIAVDCIICLGKVICGVKFSWFFPEIYILSEAR